MGDLCEEKFQDCGCEGQWGKARTPSFAVLYWWIAMPFIELGNTGWKTSLEGNQLGVTLHIYTEITSDRNFVEIIGMFFESQTKDKEW